MTKQSHNDAFVIKAHQGGSYWQPMPANGFITLKARLNELNLTSLSIFMQQLPPHGEVRPHLHQDNHEIFIAIAGQGNFILGDECHQFAVGDVVYVPPQTKHGIKNTGNQPLEVMVIISPSALEDRFKLLGRARDVGQKAPSPFPRQALESDAHGIIYN